MWTFSNMHQHKLLLFVGRRGLYKPGGVYSVVADYHDTGSLLSPGKNSINPAVKRRRRESDQQKAIGSDGWHGRGKSIHGNVWKNEMPPLKNQNYRRDDSRVSSELKKLSLEDCTTAQMEKPHTQKSARDSKGQNYEVVFGVSPCLLAVLQGRRKIRRLFVKDGETSHRASILKVCEEAHKRGVPIQRVSKKDLEILSGGRVHQGVCLQASPLCYLKEERELTLNRKDQNVPLWLVLEAVQDPMNLGAILRSAYFLGVDRVASSVSNSCPLSPVVSKASSGVMEVMRVYGYDNLEHMLKMKAAQGWEVVGTVGAESMESHVSVTQCSEFEMTKPTLLLIGGEGEGLSRGLLSLCQTLITIPAGRELCPGIESLNVSVATGILLHTLLFSRRWNR